MSGLQARMLDPRRLHLQHGPIDLVIEAFGADEERRAALAQAAAALDGVLEALVSELAVLRSAVGPAMPVLRGAVARRMASAVWPYRDRFITPMAAVAGAVADHVLAAMVRGRTLERAYVNNGGDIALHLAPGARFEVGMIVDPRTVAIRGTASIDAASPVRGVATSGRGGRSLSLGIADAVTVLARDAAAADAAATMIANRVDIDHPAIERAPASTLDADSDLGERAATVAVGTLPAAAVRHALDAGETCARTLAERGLVAAAALALRGEVRLVGDGAGIALPEAAAPAPLESRSVPRVARIG